MRDSTVQCSTVYRRQTVERWKATHDDAASHDDDNSIKTDTFDALVFHSPSSKMEGRRRGHDTSTHIGHSDEDW